MAEWCMAHPWMTFFLVWMALYILGSVIENVLRFVVQMKIILAECKTAESEEVGGSDG